MKEKLFIISGTIVSLILTGALTHVFSKNWGGEEPAAPASSVEEKETNKGAELVPEVEIKPAPAAAEHEEKPEEKQEEEQKEQPLPQEEPAPAPAPVKQEEVKTPPPPKVPAIPVPGEILQGNTPQSFFLLTATSSEKVQSLVLSGMHHLLTNREDEALNQFIQAAELDPDCALAYWGVFMASSATSGEYEEQARTALEKIAHFRLDASLPDKERTYMVGALTLSEKGAFAAGNVFFNIANRWKGDLPPRLMAALLLHDRYDDLGQPMGGQAEAISLLDDALITNPENHAILFTRALMEETAPVISDTALACVEKAAELAPDHPSTWHLKGHLLFRKGDYAAAATAYKNSHEAFDKSRNPMEPSLADDECWVKALLCEAVSLYCVGRQDDAFLEAVKISYLPMDESRPKSAGSQILKWEAATLPMRLAVYSNSQAVLSKALKSLPSISEKPSSTQDEPHVLLYKALNRYVKTCQAVAAKKEKAAKLFIYFEDVQKHYLGSQSKALEEGSISYWLRGKQLLELLHYDLKARIFPETAQFRWESSADAQVTSSLLLPPLLPFPMELFSARALHESSDVNETREEQRAILEKGLALFPNHADLLKLKADLAGNGESVSIQPVSDKPLPSFAPEPGAGANKPAPRRRTQKRAPAR